MFLGAGGIRMNSVRFPAQQHDVAATPDDVYFRLFAPAHLGAVC